MKVSFFLATPTATIVCMQYERQSEKMEVENLMEKVDSDWKAVHSLLSQAVSRRLACQLLQKRAALTYRSKVGGPQSPWMITTGLFESSSLRSVAKPWTG